MLSTVSACSDLGLHRPNIQSVSLQTGTGSSRERIKLCIMGVWWEVCEQLRPEPASMTIVQADLFGGCLTSGMVFFRYPL